MMPKLNYGISILYIEFLLIPNELEYMSGKILISYA